MSEAFAIWGDAERSEELRQRAIRLYDEFNERFWWEEEGTYYIGLDGLKRPIRSVAANAGHCLASGIVPPDRANRVVDRLMQPDMWSGWGIRTLSTHHPSYNPYSYHLGSVWPHDNATIAGGFRRAGRHTEAQQIAEGIFAAAERFDRYSLPELWAGVAREPGAYPVPYLGTNVPQAWAAASVFRLIGILCGIHTAGNAKVIYVNPDLPDWLPNLTLTNLRAVAKFLVPTGPGASWPRRPPVCEWLDQAVTSAASAIKAAPAHRCASLAPLKQARPGWPCFYSSRPRWG